jgi:hypothetical protein
MSAELKLRLKLTNHSALHIREVVGGVNGMVGAIKKALPFALAAIWRDICDKSRTVVSPESGESVL